MDQRATLEMIAPTVEEAVEKGIEQLGLSREQVQIEVLDEGGGGIFGFGERQARVRLTVAGSDEQRTSIKEDQITRETTPDLENTMSIAQATVQELLDHMSVSASVSTRLGSGDDYDSNPPIIVDVAGSDLSILIGRNAETLNALQLITRMIVGKEIGHSAHLIVDVEGYRERRERNLRQLAQRMASQALTTGRRQSLEPMNPAERRIIHIELRDHEDVITESKGQDPKRKVVIIPNDNL